MIGDWTLELALIDPMGRVYTRTAMRVDAFTVEGRLFMSPPSPFDPGSTMEGVATRIRKREFRKDILEQECRRPGRLLGEHMEDKEGWHGAHRQELVDRYDLGTSGA